MSDKNFYSGRIISVEFFSEYVHIKIEGLQRRNQQYPDKFIVEIANKDINSFFKQIDWEWDFKSKLPIHDEFECFIKYQMIEKNLIDLKTIQFDEKMYWHWKDVYFL